MLFKFLALFLCSQYASSVPVDSLEYANWVEAAERCQLIGYEYVPRTGSCYKFHGAAQAWRHALRTCQAEGGHLAIINNQDESTVLKELRNKNENDITGAVDPEYVTIGFMKLADDEWLTIHGETLSEAGFTQWSPGEPNNQAGEENCGSIFHDGLLNDAPCDDAFPFICEITP